MRGQHTTNTRSIEEETVYHFYCIRHPWVLLRIESLLLWRILQVEVIPQLLDNSGISGSRSLGTSFFHSQVRDIFPSACPLIHQASRRQKKSAPLNSPCLAERAHAVVFMILGLGIVIFCDTF